MRTATVCQRPQGCGDLIGDKGWRKVAGPLRLSVRERQIARGIMAGEKECCIAQGLGLSPHTVHSYMRRLFLKLDVHSRSQVVAIIFAAYLDFKELNKVAGAKS